MTIAKIPITMNMFCRPWASIQGLMAKKTAMLTTLRIKATATKASPVI